MGCFSYPNIDFPCLGFESAILVLLERIISVESIHDKLGAMLGHGAAYMALAFVIFFFKVYLKPKKRENYALGT